MRWNYCSRTWVALAFAALSVPACKQEEAAPTSAPAASVSAQAPVLDSKVAKVVSEVTRAQPLAAEGDPGGPPPTGVFEAGKADAELRAGQPSVLTLGSNGSEPRWQLGPGVPRVGTTYELELEVAHTTGNRQALPTLVYTLKLSAEKPKDEQGSVPTHVVAKVTKVGLGQNQPGAIPPELQKEIKALEGSTISYDVGAAGQVSALAFQLPEKKREALDGVFRPAFNAFSSFATSYPTEPVGVGAYWMVKSREDFGNVDVVAYRMFKVEESKGQFLKVSINARRYATEPRAQLPDIPPHQLLQFSGNGNGAIAVLPGQPFPIEGAMTEVLQMALQIEGSQQPALVRSQGSIGMRLIQPKGSELAGAAPASAAGHPSASPPSGGPSSAGATPTPVPAPAAAPASP